MEVEKVDGQQAKISVEVDVTNQVVKRVRKVRHLKQEYLLITKVSKPMIELVKILIFSFYRRTHQSNCTNSKSIKVKVNFPLRNFASTILVKVWTTP